MEDPLRQLRRQWERNAESDPFWTILARRSMRHGRWNPEEFFATGRADVRRHLSLLEAAGFRPGPGVALDFGCGLGRLTRPLAEIFGSAVGVDVSERMIERARELHAGVAGLRFEHNNRPDLQGFPDRSFDFLYSHITFQHMPAALATGYLREMVRLCRPGGVALVQIATHVPPRLGRFYWPPTAGKWLWRAFNRRVAWAPVLVMYALPEEEARAAIEGSGGIVIESWRDESVGDDHRSRLLAFRRRREPA